MISLGMPNLGASGGAVNDDWTYIGKGGNGTAHASTLIGDYVVIAELGQKQNSYNSLGSGGTQIFLRQRHFQRGNGKELTNWYSQGRVRVLIATSNGAFALGGNSQARYAYTFRSVGDNAMENEILLSATTGTSSDATYDLSSKLTPRLPIVVACALATSGNPGTATIGGGSGTVDTLTNSQTGNITDRLRITWRLDLQQTDSIRYQVSGMSATARSHAHILGKVTSA